MKFHHLVWNEVNGRQFGNVEDELGYRWKVMYFTLLHLAQFIFYTVYNCTYSIQGG